MYQRTILVFLTLLSCSSTILGEEVPCQDQLLSTDSEQSIKFSIVTKKNQTGHWTTQFRFNKETASKTRNWKMDFEISNKEKGGLYNFHLLGIMTAPPPQPTDYELFPGIGYYKFHYDKRYPFSEASLTCAKEGGHLVIINSMEENEAIRALYSRHKANATDYSYIGYYDPNKDRNFVTVFGQELNSTGFKNWMSGQPDKLDAKQFCVYIRPDGLWGDIECVVKKSFFCEYDLSWSDV